MRPCRCCSVWGLGRLRLRAGWDLGTTSEKQLAVQAWEFRWTNRGRNCQQGDACTCFLLLRGRNDPCKRLLESYRHGDETWSFTADARLVGRRSWASCATGAFYLWLRALV